MKRNLYVISGVTGMTGNEVARQLVHNGHHVIGFDNFFASSLDSVYDLLGNADFDFFEYNLNDNDQMTDIEHRVKLYKNKFEDIVYINCAAVVHTEHFYEVEHTFETNVNGMKRFLEQAIRNEVDVYINCSTSEVYSMQSWNETGGVREDDYLLLASAEHSQRTSYAVGKLLTEFFMKDAVAKGRIRGCSIRFANVYSNYELYPKHIIPHIVHSLRNNGQVVLLENSRKNRRSFLHNIDSCRAVLALAATKEALDGSVYNVATDEEITIIELVYRIAEKLGVICPKIIYSGYRASDPERRILNTEKIRSRTSWRPIVNLSEGLDMCVKINV
ncbi:MAG: NAD-dependent epimerase/dehydratase family protein [Odoribacter splanchnicus]|jgi:hypothetical protein|uniref:NAD-dependent epimerase/dehydratase family protein n=1 Tax=Odoribacter splanchnicus TaxID=28118 RepID=UPI001898A2A6|nr:NAD(P)-dependent oxidoreductase [Odoribacter splanchnicus]